MTLICYRKVPPTPCPFYLQATPALFALFKYHFKSISWALPPSNPPPERGQPRERAGHKRKNISGLFLSLPCSLLSAPCRYTRSLPLGHCWGDRDEFTQLLLSLRHSKFRLCLPGCCVWTPRSVKNSSLFFSVICV